jgi:4-hydroxy-tetrahydrodipicolinate synthase
MHKPRRFAFALLGLVALLGGCHSVPHAGPSPCGPPVCGWGGIYPTVLTPWCDGGGVDESALAAQIDVQLRSGVHGLLVLGTIGEGEYASMAERAQVIRVAVQAARGCVPVVVGIHTCNLAAAQAQLLQARDLGAQAVLVKYAGRPAATGAEVLGFFHQLAALQALPIFYYHYPSQTGLQLTPAEVADILRLPGVVGIKESTLDLDEVSAHVALLQGHPTCFLSGTALNLTQFLDAGGHGAMCPEAVLLPALTVYAYHTYHAGRPEEARSAQRELFVVAPLLRDGLATERLTRIIVMATQDHHIGLPMGVDHPQARLKAALNALGVPTSPSVKCPLPPLDRHDAHKVTRATRKIARLCAGSACAPAAPAPGPCPAAPSHGLLPPDVSAGQAQ